LVAISQAEAALTKTVAPISAIASRARREHFGLFVRNQPKAWLSSRILTAALPKLQLLFGQRIEPERVRQLGPFPLHQAGDPAMLQRYWRKPHHRLLPARDDDLLARLGAR
jgi:hypothetical protein